MFQDKICQNTYFALKALIDNCYYTQLARPPNFEGIGGETQSSWREYCTVRLYTARMAGHSTAIRKVAYEYFKKAIILSPKVDMSRQIQDCFCNGIKEKATVDKGIQLPVVSKKQNRILEINGDHSYFFESFHSLDSLRGIEAEAIFVDCAFMLSEEKTQYIYDNLGPCMARYPQNFFIFVQ